MGVSEIRGPPKGWYLLSFPSKPSKKRVPQEKDTPTVPHMLFFDLTPRSPHEGNPPQAWCGERSPAAEEVSHEAPLGEILENPGTRWRA